MVVQVSQGNTLFGTLAMQHMIFSNWNRIITNPKKQWIHHTTSVPHTCWTIVRSTVMGFAWASLATMRPSGLRFSLANRFRSLLVSSWLKNDVREFKTWHEVID
jgi:predicted branched-subunit amino acid permease